mgnify:CR=1 FL=1
MQRTSSMSSIHTVPGSLLLVTIRLRDYTAPSQSLVLWVCYNELHWFVIVQILQRTIRVDHVKDYKPPDEEDKNVDEVTRRVRAEGVAPRPLTPSGDEDDDFLVPFDEEKGFSSRLFLSKFSRKAQQTWHTTYICQ